MEGDRKLIQRNILISKFQSTPSAWRETGGDFMSYWDNSFQSTPSAWRETFSRCSLTFAGDISIHSLRMEGDLRSILPGDSQAIFQSTPSAWRETSVCFFRFPVATISIHSLRMEGDVLVLRRIFAASVFQSTPSAWRETYRLP